MAHPKDSPVTLVLAEATSQGNGTTNYNFNLNGWNTFAVQLDDTPGGAGDQTYTVSLALDDSVAIGSATYVDVTNFLYGSATFTTDSVLVPSQPIITAVYGRVTVVRANDGGGTDGAWDIRIRFGA